MKKRVISLFLIFAMIGSFVLPSLQTYGADVTPAQLMNGSPLLNEGGVTAKEIDKKDHVALSMYMSSMCIPLFDNYQTAFMETEQGSKGEMKQFVQFTPNENDQNLENYIDLIASVQLADRASDELAEGIEDYAFIYLDDQGSEKATIESLFEHGRTEGFGLIGRAFQGKILASEISSIKEVKLYTKLPKEENSEEKVFTLVFDGKDKQCKTAMSLATAVSAATKNPTVHLSDVLFFDAWGNICAHNNGEAKDRDSKPKDYIVFPNVWNPLILSQSPNDLKVNLLNYQLLKTMTNSIKMKNINGVKNFEDDQNKVLFERGGYFISDKIEYSSGYASDSGSVYDWAPTLSGKNLLSQYVDINNQAVSTSALWVNNGSYWKPAFYSSKYTDSGNVRIMNQVLFLNYLCMIYGEFDGFKLQEKYITIPSPEALNTALSKVSQGSEDQQKSSIITWAYRIISVPGAFVNWILGLIEGIFVGIYNSLSDYSGVEKGLTSPNMGFSKVEEIPTISFILDNLYSHWEIIFIIIVGLTIATRLFHIPGTKSNKAGFVYSLAYGLIIFILLFSGAKFMNMAFGVANNTLVDMFGANQNSWLFDYNVQYEMNNTAGSITELKTYSQQDYQTGHSLRYEQEKSPVVISNTSDAVMSVIEQSGFGYLFLGAILKQYVNGNTVSTNVEELFKRLTMLNYVMPGSKDFSVNADSGYYNMLFKAKSTSGSGDNSETVANLNAGNSNSSWSSIWPGDRLPLMFTPSLQRVESEGTSKYVFKVTGDDTTEYVLGTSHDKFYILNDSEITSDSIKQIYDKYFSEQIGNTTISKFNYYELNSLYDSNFGYFILSENVIPYFYTVWADMFKDCQTKSEIASLIQGMVKYNNYTEVYDQERYSYSDAQNLPLGDEPPKPTIEQVPNWHGDMVDQYVKKSVLMKDSKIHDYVDLKQLFTRVLPYCVNVTNKGRETYNNPDEPLIGSDYKIYKDNPKYWLFDSNWAIKLNNIYKNVDFNTVRWSESEINDQNISEIEAKILTFYEELTPRVEEVIDYFNTKGLTKQTLLRQLAILTGLEFNRQFSGSGIELQPQRLELSSIGIDTLIKDIMRKHDMQVEIHKSAGDNLLANNPGIAGFILSVLLALTSVVWMITGALRTFFFMTFIIVFIISLGKMILNVTESTPFRIICGTTMSLILSCLYFSLPLLVMVLFSNNQFITKNVPLMLKFLLITASCIFSLIYVAALWGNLVRSVGKGGSCDMGFSSAIEMLSSSPQGAFTSIGGALGATAALAIAPLKRAKEMWDNGEEKRQWKEKQKVQDMSDDEYKKYVEKNKNNFKKKGIIEQAQLGRAQAAQIQTRDMVAQQGSTLENISNTTGKIHRGVTHTNNELAHQKKTLNDVDSRSQSLIDRDNQDKGVISL